MTRVWDEKKFKLLLPEWSKLELQQKFHISIWKMEKNKYYHVKVLLNRFHLNRTTGFYPHKIQKLQKKLMSPHNVLGCPGLKIVVANRLV